MFYSDVAYMRAQLERGHSAATESGVAVPVLFNRHYDRVLHSRVSTASDGMWLVLVFCQAKSEFRRHLLSLCANDTIRARLCRFFERLDRAMTAFLNGLTQEGTDVEKPEQKAYATVPTFVCAMRSLYLRMA